MPLYLLKITGRVQGVAYRYSTMLKARELGLTGMVRNEPDGSVYAEIEGQEPQLQAMMEWCREGPPYAVVQQVQITPGPEKGYASFEISR